MSTFTLVSGESPQTEVTERISFGKEKYKQGLMVYIELSGPMKDSHGLQMRMNERIKDYRVDTVQIEGCTLNVRLTEHGKDLTPEEVLHILQDI